MNESSGRPKVKEPSSNSNKGKETNKGKEDSNDGKDKSSSPQVNIS